MIILDTHIWLWWVNENIDLIGQVRNDLIQSADVVAVSAISCFEVAWLDAHSRIELPCSRTNWFEKALEGSGINLLPITPAIASIAVDLPEHHSDPQDRIIIATALSQDAQLMSADGKFSRYKSLQTDCYNPGLYGKRAAADISGGADYRGKYVGNMGQHNSPGHAGDG